jgi:hypothetical protein
MVAILVVFYGCGHREANLYAKKPRDGGSLASAALVIARASTTTAMMTKLFISSSIPLLGRVAVGDMEGQWWFWVVLLVGLMFWAAIGVAVARVF